MTDHQLRTTTAAERLGAGYLGAEYLGAAWTAPGPLDEAALRRLPRGTTAGPRSAGSGPAPDQECRTAAAHCRHAMSYLD
ncbi:hypothetical protein ACFVHB_30005 [Kitasatospora sp. NPDC127111]|uniref:hypothetical protein n=1 Tax=Kitasatospora sp. NPDC127111 TaxID=3345363 RepID=UPI00363BB1F7